MTQPAEPPPKAGWTVTDLDATEKACKSGL
jgi:hypothetical protein